MKKRILSSCVLALSLGTTINAWSELPGLDSVKPIRTYDVGQSADDTNIVIMNHNKDHQVLLVELDENEKHVAFAVADLSIDVSEAEAISHLKASYLTGDKAGFLDAYPNSPADLSSYTSLDFTDVSTQDDFAIAARKMIVEATGYLQSQNLSIPWQEGYAALKINDDFIAVDDISEGSTNGYFKCDLNEWQVGSSVSDLCSVVDTDYSFLDLLGGNGYYLLTVDRGTSASPYISLDLEKKDIVNLENGDRFQVSNEDLKTYYTEDKVVGINNSSRIEIISSEGIEEGIFVLDPVAFIGSGGPSYVYPETLISNGQIAIFLPQTWAEDSLEIDYITYASTQFQVCNIEYKEFSLGENPYLGLVNLSLRQTESILLELGLDLDTETGDPYHLIYKSYLELPLELEELNSALSEASDEFELTPQTTLQEYRDFVNINFLSDVENFTSEEFLSKNGHYFTCSDTPQSIDAHLGVAAPVTTTFNGDLISTVSYWVSSNPKYDVNHTLSSYTMTLDGEFESHSETLFNYLMQGVNSTYIEDEQQKHANANADFYGDYPDFPVDIIDENKMLYTSTMQNEMIMKFYSSAPVLGSIASNNSALLGGMYPGLPFGQKSKSSYLLYKSEALTNTVRIIPDSLTIDPYLNSSLNTKIELDVDGLYGAELICTFDNENLFYQDSSYGSLFPTPPLSFQFPITATDGSWTGRSLLLGSPVGLTAVDNFAEINYQAAMTTAEVELSCTAMLSDIEGNSLPVVVENVVIKIDDGIHGLAGEAGGIEGTIDIPVSAEGQSVTVSLSIDGRSLSSTSIDGTFRFDQLKDGIFTMTVNSDNHVAACTTVEIVDGEVVSVEEIDLIAGDVNDDGIIDIGDISAVSASYGLGSSDEGYDEKLDLNRDGLINIQDLSIIGSHFNSVNCVQ